MKKLLLFFFLAAGTLLHAQASRPLVAELKRFDVNTVLLREGAFDDYPLWSPDGRYVCANENGNWWVKVDLENVSLYPSTWLNRTIAGNSVETTDNLSEEERSQFTTTTKYDSRRIQTSRNDVIELVMNSNFSVTLLVNRMKVWSTNGDNCHSLSLSPDERYVAFISETNGLMLMDFANAYRIAKLSPQETCINNIYARLDRGQLFKGEKMLNKALADYPKYAPLWHLKSLIYLNKGDTGHAMTYLNTALLYDSANYNYIYYKSQLYFEAGKYDNALLWIGKYIALRPDCLYGYYRRGEILEKKGDTASACENYRLAEARHSKRAKQKLKGLCGN